MKTKDFDRKFDRGESVLSQLDLSKASRDPIVEEIRQVRERLLLNSTAIWASMSII